MFWQTFPSPQVKRWAIITYKHSLHELHHNLPNNLRLRRVGNIGKVSKPHRVTPSPQAPCQNKNFLNTSKNPLKNRYKVFP